jgi:hypothetical protein
MRMLPIVGPAQLKTKSPGLEFFKKSHRYRARPPALLDPKQFDAPEQIAPASGFGRVVLPFQERIPGDAR